MTTKERPRTSDPRAILGDPIRVVLLNDDHNSFEHVEDTLERVLPCSEARAQRLALRVHNSGQAIVYEGHRERAEVIHQELRYAGLTLAPLD